MNKTSSLDRDGHVDVEMLLPWYVTGQLDANEALVVDDHLSGCSACRDLLAAERQLCDQVVAIPDTASDSYSDIPLPNLRQTRVGLGWSRVSRYIANTMPLPAKVGWLLAAQAALGLVFFNLAQPIEQPTTTYRTLSDVSAPAVGNAMIVFQPTSTEADIRAALRAAGATIVAGPTASDAYVLQVSIRDRAERLKALRAQRSVILAEPIDGVATP